MEATLLILRARVLWLYLDRRADHTSLSWGRIGTLLDMPNVSHLEMREMKPILDLCSEYAGDRGWSFSIKPQGIVAVRDAPNLSDAVQAIWAHWQSKHKNSRHKLTPDVKAKITAKLREGYTVKQLCQAVDGHSRSTWHNAQKLVSIKYALRDVDRWIESASPATKESILDHLNKRGRR